MTMTRWLSMIAAALAPTWAIAQAFPAKPINYWLAFPPGGESDVTARFQQVAFKQKFAQELVVQYKTGAGGALAWSQLNTMPADGYTIMGVNLPHIVLQPLEGNVQYKFEDIVPVHWNHFTPDALLVPADGPYKTLAEFLDAARKEPGKLTLAGSATYSANHMATERLKSLAKVDITYVPYKGTGDLIASVIGKHVSGAMSYVTLALAQKEKLRVLAIATAKRHPLFPDVPTFTEAGFPWVDGAYRGVSVPKSTPEELRKQLSDLFDQINRDATFRKQMADGGYEVIDITYDKMPAFMAERRKDYLELAMKMGLGK